jgi:uncharacterized protein (DUF1499 family)
LLRGALLAAVVLSPYLVTYSQPAPELGMTLAGLRTCPQSPNCVSTDWSYILASNAARLFSQKMPALPSHFVEPIELQDDSDADWRLLLEIVQKQPGVKVVESTDRYLHAERRTTIYGFIDDFELARLYSGTVLIRSGARLAYSDFGRNRAFVERVRAGYDGQARVQSF